MDATAQFLVQGSAAEPYRVLFRRVGGQLAAFCTCAAGQSGQFCKHRLAIVADGSANGIVSDNAHDVAVVVGWLEGTDLGVALKELADAEAGLEAAKKAVQAAKKRVASVMRG